MELLLILLPIFKIKARLLMLAGPVLADSLL